MIEKCRGIILHTLDYAESSVVVKCYTDAFGLQSYIINGVRSNRKSGIRPSHLMPLSLLELDVYHQQNKNLQRIKELKCAPVLHRLHFDPVKRSLALFMGEVLTRCIREEDQPDAALFSFLFHSLQWIDLTEEVPAVYPVYFMLQLSKYMGFYPKAEGLLQAKCFSLHEGIFRADEREGLDYIYGEMLQGFCDLYTASLESLAQNKLKPAIRRELLQRMIRYYQLHLMPFGELKSPAVLQEVLGN